MSGKYRLVWSDLLMLFIYGTTGVRVYRGLVAVMGPDRVIIIGPGDLPQQQLRQTNHPQPPNPNPPTHTSLISAPSAEIWSSRGRKSLRICQKRNGLTPSNVHLWRDLDDFLFFLPFFSCRGVVGLCYGV